MKKINNLKDIDKEFNLDNYECLSDLSDVELLKQLEFRIDLKDINCDIDTILWYMENGGNVSFEKSNNDKSEFEVKYFKHFESCNVLSCETGINPLSRRLIQTMSIMNDQNGDRKGKPIFISDDECEEIMKNGEDYHGLIQARANDSISLISNFGCWIDIDLSYPDELLINNFSKLLARWRDELEWNTEAEPIKFNKWKVVREKIIKYKVIPYLDLMKWADTLNVKIPVRVIVFALYPDSEQDSFSFTQTVKPFIEKLASDFFIDKMEMEISNSKL